MRVLNLPPGISNRDIIGSGKNGVVALMPGATTVLKMPHGDEDECARCAQEAQIYQRLKSSHGYYPSYLLLYIGKNQFGIMLEYADYGSVRKYLHEPTTQTPETAVILRWASQAAQALAFLHANGITHGDISCNNFFLDKDLNLKVGNFTNSKTWSILDDRLLLQLEVFEFGLALYEMSTGIELYRGRTLEQKVEKLRLDGFPDLSQVEGLGTVISQCWDPEFRSIGVILQNIYQAEIYTRNELLG